MHGFIARPFWFVGLLLVALTIASNQVFADTTATPAKVWLVMSDSQKAAAVRTAILAHETGWNDGYNIREIRAEESGGSPPPNPEDYADQEQSLIPTFSKPISSYVAAISEDCLKTGCPQGIMWILPCMADKPTISHGAHCHIAVGSAAQTTSVKPR